MYITKTDLENFLKKYVDEEDTAPESYCKSAIEYVSNFLGYDPEKKEYVLKFWGENSRRAVLEARPISEITSFKIDGVEADVEKLEIVKDNYVEFADGVTIFSKCHKYEISYTAGFDIVPEIIRITALQIGSLFWESAGGNLAVSSTSFADTGSRVFNNFKADRFLDQISAYKRNM